ncbi:MAG TPA: exosortase [Novosphingobium sp.]
MGAPNRASLIVLGLGLAGLVVPTLIDVAGVSWSSEQGSHGPIVLAIAVWLLWRRAPMIWAARMPGDALVGGLALVLCAVCFVLAHVAGSIVIQSGAMFGFLLATCYLFVGWRAMRAEWFPFAYFAFVLPPPGSFVAWATQPLRLEISELAVRFYALFGLPVAREGLQIFIAQYVLEVKAACGGLNSMISLTAVSLFYGYIRGRMSWRYGALFLAVAIAFAILANWVRVCLLVFITYQFGDRAAQGFLHGFSGLTTFGVALLGTMAVDNLLENRELRRRAAAAQR